MTDPNPLPACLSHLAQRDAGLIARARSQAFIEAAAFLTGIAGRMDKEAAAAKTAAKSSERHARAHEHRALARAMLDRAES